MEDTDRTNVPDVADKPKAPSVRSEVLEWIKLIAIVLVIGFVVRTFLFQIIRVDGPSMQDTLFTDEYMFVGRLAYYFIDPQPGDIVICHYPENKDDYVKRVVGVPGDTIEIRAGVVYRNGQPVDEPYVVHPQTYEDMPAETLGENEYLVFGDNRANSLDGRILGPLEKKDIKGRVLAVIWPLSKIHSVRT